MIGRIFRMVRTPVTLLILLGVLVWGAWWGYTNVLRPVPAAPPDPCVNQRVPRGQLKSNQVVVNVFNGGDRKGLAAEVGRSLRERGFRVSRTANTGEKIQRTVIVGAAAKDPEVQIVKAFFKKSVVRADKRPDHSVDVLVGNKYGGFDKKAKTTYQVKGSTLCLPSQGPSSSASAPN